MSNHNAQRAAPWPEVMFPSVTVLPAIEADTPVQAVGHQLKETPVG
jgi:hypothetical protein